MGARTRALLAGAAAVAGIAIAGGVATPASATALDYKQYQATYATEAECHEGALPWLWPTNPGGADYYTCEPDDGEWDLYLWFLT